MVVPTIPLHPHGHCYTTYIFSKNLFTGEELARLEPPPEIPSRGHLGKISKEAAVSQIMKDAERAGIKISRERAARTLQAIWDYSSDAQTCKNIRMFQRGEIFLGKGAPGRPGFWTKAEIAKVKQRADDIESYLKFAPRYKGEVFRTLDVSDDLYAQFESYYGGEAVDMRGLSSWSSDATESISTFGGERPVVFAIDKPKMGCSVNHLSLYPDEKEILFSKSLKFKVSDPSQVIDDVLYVFVEEI